MALAIFACSFAVVLALGLQQLNITANLRGAAFVTSLHPQLVMLTVQLRRWRDARRVNRKLDRDQREKERMAEIRRRFDAR